MSQWKTKVSMPTQMGKACLAFKSSVGVRGLALIGVEEVPPIPTNLYTGASSYPGKVVKTKLEDFTDVSTLTLTTDEAPYFLAIKDDYLYIALYYSNPCIVVKVELSTFTEVGTLTFATGEGYPNCVIIDGNYLYVGLDTEPGKIVKVDLSTFTKDSVLDLASEEISIQSFAVSGSFLYVGTSNAGYAYAPKVVKVNLATFTRVGAIVFTYPDDSPKIPSLATDSSYLYAALGTYVAEYARIVRISLATFTEVDRLEFDTYPTNLASDGYVIDGTTLYGIIQDDIFKVNLTSFTYVSSLTEPTGWRHTCGLVIGDSYLYVGYENTAATTWRIYKVDLTTFAFIDNLDLDADEYLSIETTQAVKFT